MKNRKLDDISVDKNGTLLQKLLPPSSTLISVEDKSIEAEVEHKNGVDRELGSSYALEGKTNAAHQ
jgi:hypothetical protein